jgi:hypothetical protein
VIVISPLVGSLAVGGMNAILGGLGASASSAAAQQDYMNQRAFRGANARFAKWQAGFNKKLTDANQQQNYWQETVNYNQNLAYTKSLRNYELLRSINQAKIVEDTRAAAGADFIRGSEAIGQAMSERSMQDAVALRQYTIAAVKARASIRARGQEGASIDRMVNDFARQVGDYETITAINDGFRQRQYTREQAGQVAQYLSRYNSQPFYEAQPYMDPIAPFAPLPSLLEAPAPTFTGAGPSGAATGLNVATGLMGAVGAGLNVYGQLNSWTNSGRRPGQGGA